MATNTDIKEYTSNDNIKKVEIKGQAGKQIKIEAVSLQLVSGKAGINNATTVYINGIGYAAWKYTSNVYSGTLTYDKYPYVIETGKDAVLTWEIVTGNKKYPAKMKNASCTYSYIDVDSKDPVDNSVKYLVAIECISSEKAKAAIEDIKSKGILKDDMTIYIAEKV